MPAAAPPSPQEIHRKLSVHSVARSPRPPSVAAAPVSGTESDSDSLAPPDILAPSLHRADAARDPAAAHALSSIAERPSASGADTDDDDDADDGAGGWRTAARPHRAEAREGVLKAGYLWKKGERRKTWKKRWFVLRPAHLAYYKTSAEYELLRLLALADVHSCTAVALKRHAHAFGLVSPVRTFYLQAAAPADAAAWVAAIEDARHALMATSTQSDAAGAPAAGPAPAAPRARAGSRAGIPPPPHAAFAGAVTSSDSEDAYAGAAPPPPSPAPARHAGAAADPGRLIVAGYLMKCGSKRRNWRKRWFVLTGEKLVYSGSHMDTKAHRVFPFGEILDALEYELPPSRQTPVLAGPASPTAAAPAADALEEGARAHTFKIVTTKRALLLCAPSEEDEIKWLGAVRALIARRSGAGVVPGEATGDAGAGAGAAGGAGLKGKVRRMSASGSGGGDEAARSVG